MTILKEEVKEIKAVHGKRKEKQSGKRLSLKNGPLVTSENVAEVLKAAKKATKVKKKAAARNHRNHRKKDVSSDEDVMSSASDSLNSSGDSEVEILDRIIVSREASTIHL